MYYCYVNKIGPFRVKGKLYEIIVNIKHNEMSILHLEIDIVENK